MNLIIGKFKNDKKDDIINTLRIYNYVGTTIALIEMMSTDITAHMVVADYATAHYLSKQYNMNIYRFIPLSDLANKLMGRTGPLFFDLPAVIDLAKL